MRLVAIAVAAAIAVASGACGGGDPAEGANGTDGTDGAEGPQGPQGPEGPEGPQGPRGPQGAEGPEGPQGPQGERGPRGAAITLISSQGRTLGFPIRGSYGTQSPKVRLNAGDLSQGFLAHRENPAPEFPQGFIILRTPPRLSWTGPDCTGTPLTRRVEPGAYENVLFYNGLIGGTLYSRSGEYRDGAFIGSFSDNLGSCHNYGGKIHSGTRFEELKDSSFYFEVRPSLPWTAVVN